MHRSSKPDVVAPYSAYGAATAAPPAHHQIAEQMAGVRQHLADLATNQAHINRTINPPLWRRILRSRLVHRLIWLGIIVIVGSVGVPLLIENVFGDHKTDSNRNKPLPKEKSGTLSQYPQDAVQDVYQYVAHNRPAEACHGFSLTAQIEFTNAVGATDCGAAVLTLYRQVTDPAAYGEPNLRQVPEPEGRTDTISSCEFTVSGGPRLGTFTLTEQAVGWEITHYIPPAPCPTPTN